MLNIRKWVLAVFFASMPLAAMADAPVKLGVVNVALLLEQAPQAKDATANLEKEFAPQQAELKALATKLEKKQSDYQKDKAVMSESQQMTKEREISMMTREIQRRRNDIQELLNLRRNEELAKLQTLVNDAIKAIGKEKEFDLILYEGIAYTNNRLDVTQDVLKHLQEVSQKQRANFNK
ncbi:OmpH family outer membrane protein [Thiomicrorhabdus cannonii]|uniref:OmpH family outer membrane protein n=1 Tax=Thiomicrorhabdus cannonii TaxID=2748011 RepID=UPI0015B8D2D0|nr:OmpH family outer membrane protein [Thiomicrorhabdus cannonii]